ncbi:hypothetical protein [Novosphingobium profundi]|uniref:hypothetical protein n=1 Tax=Novosphingobium profundi TaxID=1774954 RepID=UPI001CFE165B|nr:hypothetical protein [Novosphingobium profundi]
MHTLMNSKLGKGLVGTVAVGAMAASTATPAMARDGGGGVDAGTVIAGALVVGGIAALAASASNDRDRYAYGHPRGRDRRYGRGFRGVSSRDAVDRCVAAATRTAHRNSGRARVTDIRDVDRKDYGYKIKGRIAVEDRRGGRWDRRSRVDTGKFTCKVNYRGGLRDLDFSGIRGLR